ncbi:Spo0E like sporulation regulatory protein [Edaphobacillus lindanitolerans]|uniref:Spo0E like sporulation regulatory protein n=1 Tax=Edaphobacillus lindanitolerans TaxID=550447 RepID=A0A1U7PIW7_9BACI|nr:Spo0E like sporulation regulatory protein [Edaphobacillus lindanitolerans]
MEFSLLQQIEQVRIRMIENARIRGLDDGETIRLSTRLDRLMNLYDGLKNGRRPVLRRRRQPVHSQNPIGSSAGSPGRLGKNL